MAKLRKSGIDTTTGEAPAAPDSDPTARWRESMVGQRFLNTTSKPQQLSVIYTDAFGIPQVNPSAFTNKALPQEYFDKTGPLLDMAAKGAQYRKSEFTNLVEDAYLQHQGNVPVSFWVGQGLSAHDMAQLGGPEIDVAKVNQYELDMARVAELNATVDARLQEAVKKAERWRSVTSTGATMEDFAAGMRKRYDEGGTIYDKATGEKVIQEQKSATLTSDEIAAMRKEIELEEFGRADENFETEIDEWRENTRNHHRATVQAMQEARWHDEDLGIPASGGFLMEDGNVLETPEDVEAWIDLKTAEDEQYLRGALQSGADPTELLSTDSFALNAAEGGMNIFSGVMKFGAMGVSGAWALTDWAIQPFVDTVVAPSTAGRNSAVEYYARQADEEREATIAEYEEAMSLPDWEMFAQATQQDLLRAWNQLPETHPEEHQDYVRMAGGLDPFALFAADVRDAPEAKEQMAYYIEEVRRGENALIMQLEEDNFRLSDKVLETIGTYGRLVPGRLSTWASILWSDEDFHDRVIHGKFENFWSDLDFEAEKSDYSPAGALGLEGSLAGLMIDLGAGIMFDPTVWLFGAGGSARSSLVKSAAEAKALAKAATTVRFVDDTISAIRSPSQGMVEAATHGGWMGTRHLARLLDATGWVDQWFPNRNWMRSKKGGGEAMEITVEAARKFAGEAEELFASELDDIGKLADDLQTNGMNDPIELTVSRADNTIHLTDGNKRLLAVELNGGKKVPVVLRVVDEVAGRPTNLGAAADPGLANTLASHADQALKSGKNMTAVFEDGPFTFYRQGDGPGSRIHAFYTNETTGTTVGIGGVNPRRGEIAVTKGYSGAAEAGQRLTLTDGTTVAQKLIDVARIESPQVLEQLANSSSVTTAAWKFLNKEADRLGLPNPFQSLESGVKLADLIPDFKPNWAKDAGTVYRRADRLFDADTLHGPIDRAAIEAITEKAIMDGYIPDGATQTALARHVSNAVKDAGRKWSGGLPGWLDRYLTKQNINTRFELFGHGSSERIIDAMWRLWGSDTASANSWFGRVMDVQRQSMKREAMTAQRMELITAQRHRIASLRDATGGGWQGAIENLSTKAKLGEASARESAVLQRLLERNKRLRKQLSDEEAALNGAWVKLQKDLNTVVPEDMHVVLKEMWDDYNRKHIATNKQWAGKVGEDGLVPWVELQKGRLKTSKPAGALEEPGFFTTEMKQLADELGKSPEDIAKLLNGNLNTKMAFDAPLAPLEMILASEWGGAKWIQLTHRGTVSAMRDLSFGMQTLWVLDKVFRGATAMTVSFDELMRIYARWGGEAVTKWADDRAIMMAARGHAALNNPIKSKLGLGKDAVSHGTKHLTKYAQERMSALQNFPTHLKNANRQFYEGTGIGYVDILPNDPGYLDAARHWSATNLQDKGFRAFLRGEEAFTEWFMSGDGTRLRTQMFTENKGPKGATPTARMYANAKEAYELWNGLFDGVILKKAYKDGQGDAVKAAWKETAQKIDDLGGAHVDVPDWTFEHLGSVRGIQKSIDNKAPITGMTDYFFDRFFADPVNYRRGFIAELVRNEEKRRLTNLYKSQNKRIMTDMEAEKYLGLNGYGGSSSTYMRQYLSEMASRQGIVTESMMADIIERAVAKEIDHVLYSWDKGSRLGSQSRFVFPFGRPWADMAGHWGREMLRKPVLRGYVNKTNFLGMKSLNSRGYIPFNPRTPAMVSRIANTDFTIDRGFVGEAQGGLLPGSSQTDISPLLFLPTKGDNAWASLIPGMGLLPLWAVDLGFDRLAPDPVEDPQGYAEALEVIGDFLPAIKYEQGGAVSRIAGGGTAAALAGLAADMFGGWSGQPYWGVTSNLGDISREISRSRELRVEMAKPEYLEALKSASTWQEVETLMEGAVHDSDRRASLNHGMETLARWMAPANSQFDTSVQEVMDVWLTASVELGIGVRPEYEGYNEGSPEEKRQYANDVRRAFFKRPQWEQDLMVAQYPALAVNMVGMWTWSAQGIAENLPGSDTYYRTGGSDEDISRHQYYVENGWVRPTETFEQQRIILGYMMQAPDNAARQAYEFQAEWMNENLWDQVLPLTDVPAKLEGYLSIGFQTLKDYNITTPEELWRSWSTVEKGIEAEIGAAAGLELGSEEWDRMKRNISLPGKLKAWNSTWPGISGAPTDFDQLGTVFGVSPESRQIMEGLELEVLDEFTGEQFYNELQSKMVKREDYIFTQVAHSYNAYRNNRIEPIEVSDQQINEILADESVDPEWRTELSSFIFESDRTREKYRNTIGGIPREEQEAMQDRFEILSMTGEGTFTNWDNIWKYKFERSYGPLGWEPPVPPTPVMEDGSLSENASTPYIRHIQDGDSMYVSDGPGSAQMYGVRLLGVRAADFGYTDQEAADATADMQRLRDALDAAVENGDTIYLVRDPKLFGSNTDRYGRVLAWLWIGDKPYYFQEDFRPSEEPSETDR